MPLVMKLKILKGSFAETASYGYGDGYGDGSGGGSGLARAEANGLVTGEEQEAP